ncbi:MAG: hypothetical protein LBV27_07055 [Oscillospiraceae bacterium]|jgi:hypothetical protein|nr:hypothetical protein [Oscillospiraceae bacterium]
MLNPEELAAAVTAAAITISKNLNARDTAVLAAVFTQLGDTLVTIVAARDRIEDAGSFALGSVKEDGETTAPKQPENKN